MRGVHTALVTPFDASGEVDWDAYANLVTRQLQGGVHGLVPCGTTGEAPTLTADEWCKLLQMTKKICADKVPVTVGVGTNSTATTVARIQRAQELGADAGLMVFPYYNKPNDEGLRAHVTQALSVGLPLVLYHVPGRTAQHLSASLLAELTSMPGVIALKEATGDLSYAGDVLTSTSTPVLSGDDFTFLPLMALGGSGVISVVSNVAPARTVRIYEAFQMGAIEEARSLMQQLLPLVRFLFTVSNPVPCKAALAELGLCEKTVRGPLAAYNGPGVRSLLDELEIT